MLEIQRANGRDDRWVQQQPGGVRRVSMWWGWRARVSGGVGGRWEGGRGELDSPMASAAEVLDGYGAWLDRQALAPRTRTAYRRWVGELLEHLLVGDELDAF